MILKIQAFLSSHSNDHNHQVMGLKDAVTYDAQPFGFFDRNCNYSSELIRPYREGGLVTVYVALSDPESMKFRQ